MTALDDLPLRSLRIAMAVEDIGFLWLRHDGAVAAPNVRLADLVRLHERLDAYAALLHTGGDLAWRHALDHLKPGEAGTAFAMVCLALEHQPEERLSLVLDAAGPGLGTVPSPPAEDDTDMASDACFIAAIAMAERHAAVVTIDRWRQAAEPALRAIAIAAVGARRSDPGTVLGSALADPSHLVRARAYRTTGQLGRHDLMARLRPGLADPDPECRFWSAWAAARMGAGEEALGVLAEIAWTNQPRAVRALDLLLRCLEVPHANAWLREFARLPDRQRDLIRATGVVGDPVYVPWLIQRMAEPETARLAGEAFSMITGLDLAYRDLDRKPPAGFESGPNDDPADENVALDEDDHLPWPDPGKIGSWWLANLGHYKPGTTYFLGAPKQNADWLGALSDAFQRQRRAAALELAIRMPKAAMFEVRARGRLQRRLIARSRGLA